MMATDALRIYLNDHLAGSRSALELLEHLIESTADHDTRALLAATRREISKDRDTLEGIIRRVSGEPSVLRDIGGWMSEKIARLKLAVDDPSDGPLRRLEALEILALGIEGKAGLWRALAIAAPGVPGLSGVDFGDLLRRASAQHARIEDQRIKAAQVALTVRSGRTAADHAVPGRA